MSARTVTVAAGISVLLDGEVARIVEFDGRKVAVRHSDGRYSSVDLAEFVSRARGLDHADDDSDPGLVLGGLSTAERERVAQRAAHVREVLTGYTAGHAAAARVGEPRAAYADGVPLGARYAAKAAELSMGVRTVEYWVAAYRDAGEAGLVDDRRRGRGSTVDPRWEAAVVAELAAGVSVSTPTRSAVLMRAAERLEREHGVAVVALPSQATAYRRLAELVKGTNAVSGSAKARRSIAQRPKGVYGRLRATRPGEYLILDTQDLDVFAMEPVTCRWVRAQLTVAQDLFDRQILGLKVTPVSTKSVDVASVLFESVTGRSAGSPALGPVHGLPEHLVFTEENTGADAEIWCPPETLVIDHGRAFLSAHVIGVCARLGISIQPAQPRKPTDKPTVERFFRSLREGLIQHLPSYKGPDLHSRGEGLEEQAFLFLHELEDVIRDWIVTVYHPSEHDGIALAEWPNLAMSPNDMFALGIVKAGLLRIPATPELVFEFLRVLWRTVQHYGVDIDGRRYNGPALDSHRNATSPYGGVAAGKWPIRVNDDDVRHVYFQEPEDGSWHQLVWEHAPMLGTPFSSEAAKYARMLATRTDRFADPAAALTQVLGRWAAGEVTDRRERRMAARLSAERTGLHTLADVQFAAPEAPELLSLSAADISGDDDVEAELLDDLDGFYDDALEVLE
ncbi:transposase [Rhodococcus sp. WS3]|uniref:helix-turn-helix domain-containing protein n=1 Tax=unclassified Rhodococcus (in: high G+C Gram-positive bacteria) TaxID=192944 RepID=UPI0005D3E9EB|nr:MULTISPECIES: helix-turn-helix domain-containing protein [unclassified Rhodococcus (in: high G+C Gram-positive bacteria)]KJF19332.1 Integrase core domain protein [Rhodococcus sp. AD45]ROZ42718.1 transposase [Rhodococcus sp. WS3]RZL21794.1 MAG: transposase [Rhodococcus sp. (in: high G+C Gram-positive bacteria)]